MRLGRPRVALEVRRRFWSGIRSGLGIEEAAVAAGGSITWGRVVFRQAGGVNPFKPDRVSAGRYLSRQEREEIAALRHGGAGVRAIARQIGRDPGTVSRELRKGATTHGYRAWIAQEKADAGRRAPRGRKLLSNLRLRREVQKRLRRRDSPEQIAGRLKRDFPDDPEMRVSPETIYQALYLQARGGLKRELAAQLRTGRVLRKPRRKEGERRGRIPGMVMISERPAAVEDRAVPGDWEGDLIIGSIASNTAVGTLVERASGFVLLVHLPDGHSALAVQEALTEKIGTLPEQLRRSLTWDQGHEMMNHAKIAEATGIDIYFCDPHSPWQRGSNENTNGLLRQYLPKGADLSLYGAGILDKIAAELNSRPRKRHDWQTPAEVLDQLLSKTEQHHGVA